MPGKLDLRKTFPDYHSAKPSPSLVAFGPRPYLSIQGRGEPEGEVYIAALGALYGVAYSVKRLCKAEGYDFIVPNLRAAGG